jgi:hypothetical protein
MDLKPRALGKGSTGKEVSSFLSIPGTHLPFHSGGGRTRRATALDRAKGRKDERNLDNKRLKAIISSTNEKGGEKESNQCYRRLKYWRASPPRSSTESTQHIPLSYLHGRLHPVPFFSFGGGEEGFSTRLACPVFGKQKR